MSSNRRIRLPQPELGETKNLKKGLQTKSEFLRMWTAALKVTTVFKVHVLVNRQRSFSAEDGDAFMAAL